MPIMSSTGTSNATVHPWARACAHLSVNAGPEEDIRGHLKHGVNATFRVEFERQGVVRPLLQTEHRGNPHGYPDVSNNDIKR